MPIYRTEGTLTAHIESENVVAAQRYLVEDEMAKYLDPPLNGVVESLVWTLDGDGFHYTITAFALRELTDDELKQLSSECSGQNSDGLGESFEQQDFAELHDEPGEEDCYDCEGAGQNEDEEDCPSCDGAGYYENDDNWSMISFDWKTNDLPFVRVL